MSEIITQERQIEDVFIEIIESKHEKNEQDREKFGEDIPLENISVGIDDFMAFFDKMPEVHHIDELNSKVNGWLWSLSSKGEIEPAGRGRYKPIKHRRLYNRLRKKLRITS